MKKFTRLLALFLVFALCVQMLPVNVLAEELSADDLDNIEEAEEGRPGTTVLGELSDRRAENEKHFRMDDGSYIAVDYGMPVHYTEDEGNTWEDIDNTLSLSNSAGNSQMKSIRRQNTESVYSATNGDTSKSFAYDLRSGFLFSAQTGSHTLRMSLANEFSNRDQADLSIRSMAINSADKEASTEETTESGNDDQLYSAYNQNSIAEISYPNRKDTFRDNKLFSFRTSADSNDQDKSISEQVLPEKLRAEVLYRDVYDDVDLHYELCSYNIKETILVNQPRENYSFTFYFDSGDMTPLLTEDGSVELQNAENEVVYLIPAPYMTDSAGEYSEAVTYSLEETDSGSWALTVTADEAWMNDQSRVFPVSIDPTLYDAVHPSDILKRCVASGGDPENYIHKQNLVCGYHPTYGQTEVYFKISQLPKIPAGSEAISAIFSFYQNDYRPQTSNSIVLSVKPCLSGISNYNSLTWNGRPSLGPVLDYNNSSYNTIGKWLSWDVTSEAKKWYANASSNYGLAMTSDATSSNQRRAWFTYSTVFFYVTYRDMTGIEPYYTYQTLGADRAGAAYISDYTGALTTVTPLVSYASTINPFSLNLVYNSSYFKGEGPDNVTVPLDLGYGMRMGSGMKLDLLQKVEYVDLQDELESSGTKRYIKYTDSDGTAHYFAKDTQKDSSGKWYFDEDGLGLKITEYAANYFRMEDDNGNKWYFVYGFLTMIQDANGNSINLWFKHSDGTMATNGYPYGTGNTLDHITLKNNGADAITVATFAYNTDDGANTLHSVTDAAGNVYSFVYSCHKLRSILRNSSAYVDYIHPYNNKTNRFVNPVVGLKDCISEYSLSFTYADSKISSYFEKGGNTQGAGANITRVSGERTTYTDWGNDRTFGNIDDISTTYLFDYAGRTVNAFSTDVNGAILGASNAIHSGTGNTDKKNNRTLRSAGIGLSGVSMIRNGSFELSGSGMDWTIVKPEGSSCAATIKTGELVRTGTHAFKTWVSSSATGPTGGKKLIGILTAGQTYTASVYVNTSAATGLGNKGVYLRILDSYGSYKTGEYLNYKTDTAIDGGWVKLTFSFTPERSVNHYICVYDEGVRGEVYYDDLQVEAGSSPTNVNLLDNGGISSSAAGWLTESNAVAGTASVAAIQGNNAIQITGNPKTDKYVHQTVSLNQPGTQTYVLSGWAKANAVPDNQNPVKENNETDEHYRERVAMDTNKQYGLRAILTYDDTNHTKEYHYVSFNADVTDWQFASLAIVPKQPTKTVASIQVVCAYEKNANTAYFDNLSLVKEVAQTMKYDKDGNLVSVQSTGNKQETSTYNNGNLTQVKTGGDGTFDYSYDNKHNVTEATNGTVKEKYTYDGMGNMLSTTLSKAEGTPDVSETVKGGKTYTNSGNLVLTSKGANGCYTTFTYGTDASKMFGAATKVRNPVGTETVTSYLNDGRVNNSKINGNIAVIRSYDS
ncbi:MAG: DNRLRE domain-containing protein, partial [Acidaminococcaceae bacterium]|nr:DNRLRE domain-containing protein [Acidaminococcaceae bacterium]